MNEFVKELKKLKEDGVELFYNSKGNEHAYKLFIRHISFCTVLGYGKIKKGVLILEKDICIIDFDNLKIDVVECGEKVFVVDLEEVE